MSRKAALKLMPFNGQRNPEHEKEAPGKFQVTRHNWNWGYHEDYPLYPYSFEEALRLSPTWFSEHYNRYMLLTIVPEGEMLYKNNSQEFLLHGNNLLVIPQGQAFYFQTTHKVYYRKLSLFLLGTNLAAIAGTLGLNEMQMISLPDSKAFIEEMRRIDSLLIPSRPEDMPEMSGIVLKLLTKLSLLQRSQEDNSLILKMAQARLSSDFKPGLNIADIAAELRISPSSLLRLFKEKLNMSPRDYRIRCKIKHAKELLKSTSLSNKEISYRLGYCNQFHFSNEFTRSTGLSPNRYRKQQNIGADIP